MTTGVTTNSLNIEAEKTKFLLSRPFAGTLQLNWAYPEGVQATAGALLLISEQPLNPSNYPSNGATFTASADLANPEDTIGANSAAQVVGYFPLNTSTTSLTVSGADDSKIYYAALFVASNVQQYSKPILSYPLDDGRSTAYTDSYTGDIPTATTPPLNPGMGEVYYNPVSNSVSMWNGAAWIPASKDPVRSGSTYPIDPNPGEFFYNSNTKELDVWSGTAWVKANTSQEGVPMYAKQGVGTDGTSDERAQLIDKLKLSLGWPQVCVELKEAHFDMAITYAIDEFRKRADNAYHKRYYLFNLIKGQQLYYLNDQVAGTNAIVNVVKLHRLSALGAYTTNDSGIYTQTFLNQLNSPTPVDMTSIHLLANLSKELEKIFAGNLMFTWTEATRQIVLQRKIYRDELIVIESYAERTEQDLLVDRWCKTWLQDWAEAKCMEVLGNIRSKFGSLPGASGSITLNGSELLSRADQKFEQLKQQILNYEVGNQHEDWQPILIG